VIWVSGLPDFQTAIPGQAVVMGSLLVGMLRADVPIVQRVPTKVNANATLLAMRLGRRSAGYFISGHPVVGRPMIDRGLRYE
jgi:hypothetical protein